MQFAKGKRIDNNEWVVGYPIKFLDNKTLILVPDERDDTFDKITVIPETVCFCSGMKDKKGTDIYQGDKYKVFGIPKTYTVYFKNGAFTGGFDEANSEPIGWDVKADTEYMETVSTDYIEVIGNIHD